MTLVLLHGFTGAPSSWDDVVALLPAGARVVRPTLLGHDGRATGARTWEDEVDRLARELEGIRGAVLAGYSLGGRVALALARRHPALASRLVLIGAGAGLRDPGERAARRAEDDARAQLLESAGIDAFVESWEHEPIFATQAALPAVLRARHRARRLAHDPAGLAASLRVLGQGVLPASWSALPQISIPVTLAVGSEDRKLLPIMERMRAALPRAELVVMEGAGHDLVLERPAEVAAILRTGGLS